MKSTKQFILGFITATLLLTCVIGVSANGLMKDIVAQVSYEIKIMLNGKEFNPKETDGTELKPLVYNGRTYLPVRALCDAVGVNVEWEGSTKTIKLSTEYDKNEVSLNYGDEVVVTINGENKISLSEANAYLTNLEVYYERNYGPNVWDQSVGEEGKTVADLAKENALNSSINANILALLAKEKGVKLSDEDANLVEQLAQDFMGQINKESTDKEGLTVELIKKMIQNQKLSEALYEKEMDNYAVDEVELNTLLGNYKEYKGYKENGYAYYTMQVRARHILFKTIDESGEPLSEEKKAEVKAKAEEVLVKVKAGEDFVELVKEYTDDTSSKETGGEYTFKRGVMVAEFENAAFSMKPGEVSEIVETVYGYHIIKLEEIIEPTEEEIEAIKANEESIVNSAIEELKQQAFNKKFEEWKAGYKVEVNNDVWDGVEVGQSSSKE